MSWVILIQPQNTFNDDDPADALQQLVGGFFFASFAPLGGVALAMAVRAFLTGRAGEYVGSGGRRARGPSGAARSAVGASDGLGLGSADADAALLHSYAATDHGPSAALSVSPAARRAAASALKRSIQPVGCPSACPGSCALLVLIGLLVIATSSLTNVWNFSAHSYLPYLSPYSLINIQIGDNYVSKVYEDVVVFFSALTVLVLMGVLGKTVPTVRALFTRRMRCLSPSSGWWNPWATGITVGEILVTGLFLGLFGYWIHYWGFNYKRIRTEALLDPDTELQVAARVLGHLSTLSMAFLLMPSARNSLWEAALGVPFERAIKYHRLLGAFSWLLVTLHMLVWMGKWAKQGILWNNVITIDNLAIDPYTFHWDNFTILVTETAWLIMTISVILAVFVRRQSYEWFYYLHQYAGILFFVAGVWHAWGFWYYAAGGMILWLVDKLARLYKGSAECRLISIEHHGGITRIQLDAPSFDHSAGQYAFLNIPSIDEWQWHPFTVASAPSSPYRTFLIKDMGAGTWTHELSKLASLCSDDARPFSPRICADSPYGRPRDYTGKRTLVLVAGGVGITPVHSIFADLYERACAAAESKGPADLDGERGAHGLGSIQHVRLVWVVRNPQEANIVAETLYRAHTHNPSEIFAMELYCTTLKRTGKSSRPNVLAHPGAIGFRGQSSRTAGYEDPDIEDEAAEGAGHSLEPPLDAHPAPFRDISPEAITWVQSRLNPGRPPIGKIFGDIRRVDDALSREGSTVRAGESGTCMSLVCGPKGLIASVSEAAFEHGLDYHEEEFYF
jgi:predicted ferric reductase